MATYSLQSQSGTITSYLPLTTTYVAPQNCFSTFFVHGIFGDSPAFAFDPNFIVFDVDPLLQCLPSAAVAWWWQTPATHTLANYTGFLTTLLGPIVCPEAYTTAEVISSSHSTFIACCPSGYDFITVMEGGYPGQCTSSLSAGQVISYYYNPFSLSSGPSTWILTTGSVTEVTSLAGVQVNGYIFSTTSTTSALLTPTPLSKSTPQSSGIPSSGVTVTSLLPTQTILPSRTTSALSTGRIVGIASGVITFFYGFMILTYILIRRSRRKAKQAALSSTLQSRADDFRRSANDQGQKSELPVNEPVLELADRKNLWHELG